MSDDINLDKHESHSQEHYHKLMDAIKHIKEQKMSEHDNTAAIIAAMGNRGAGDGLGLGGGGIMGGLVLGALLGNNRGGLFGNNGDGAGCVTPMQLTSGLASVIDSNQNTTLLQSVGDIKAAVPLAEAQVQLALAGAQADIMSQSTANATAAALASQMTNKNISDAIASGLAGQAQIKESVAAYGVANLTATKDSQYAVTTAVRDDGDKTRALLSRQYEDTLNRQLTEANNALAELRSASRVRESEINITNTNTATATQSQTQFQAQQQLQILAQLAAEVRNLTGDIQAVRQGQVIFNSGTMRDSGSQSASNTKVA